MLRQTSVLARKRSIPFAIAELVTEYQLGLITKVYSTLEMKKQVANTVIFTGIIVVIGAGFIYYSMSMNLLIAAIVASTGLICIIVGISMMLMARRSSPGPTCYICTEGLFHIDGDQIAVVRWDEVTEMRKVFSMGSNKSGITFSLQEYCLRRYEKPDFILRNDIWGMVNRICQSTEEYITPLLFAEAITSYEAGMPSIFGSVELDAQGITLYNGWRTLSWQFLKQVNVHPGAVYLYKIGVKGQSERWDTVYLSGMPNPTVFVALLKNILGSKLVEGRPVQ